MPKRFSIHIVEVIVITLVCLCMRPLLKSGVSRRQCISQLQSLCYNAILAQTHYENVTAQLGKKCSKNGDCASGVCGEDEYFTQTFKSCKLDSCNNGTMEFNEANVGRHGSQTGCT